MTLLASTSFLPTISVIKKVRLVRLFFAGLFYPLGFAPFHLPLFTILSLAFLYYEISKLSLKKSFLAGLTYGIGLFGFGVSWVAISVHDFGHLSYILSGLITFLLVLYLALFPAFTALLFNYLYNKNYGHFAGILFAAIWVLSEYARATFLSGFPWLNLGVSQLDTPLKYLAPILGVYGLSFLTCLAATLLFQVFKHKGNQQKFYLLMFLGIILIPNVLKNTHWTTVDDKPISVGIIQSNLSMRDKWDETLFWNLLAHYKSATQSLLGTQLIVMPESAIPLPSSYLADYLDTMNQAALDAKSAILLGMMYAQNENETSFSNALVTLGDAQGHYKKQHLVPFGEFIPRLFQSVVESLGIPDPNVVSGDINQLLIRVAGHPIASLICFELAYPNLLRAQLPEAEWIISVSDNGWFGRSFASYQQVQMAQMLSLQTGRYQVVSNNNALSSVINTQGEIIAGLPAFSSGILRSELYSSNGSTPWVVIGDSPYLILCGLLLIIGIFLRVKNNNLLMSDRRDVILTSSR